MRSGNARDQDIAALDVKNLSIKEIRAQISGAGVVVSPEILRALRCDGRQGVKAIFATLKKRIAQARQEQLRITKMLSRERVLWREGSRYVAGVDEVGIGPLAGPVVAAAVIFEPGTALAGVDDSKRLDAETRVALARMIRERALGYGIGIASVEEIDRLNVYHAGLLAMHRAVEALPLAPQHVLVDARTIPDLSIPQSPLIKGDEICFSIAAASIVAKTHRDRLMTEWDDHYPQYGFHRHKGYATPEHQAAIRRHGPCALHRQSYSFLQELRGRYSPEFYAIKERLSCTPSKNGLREVERRVERAGTTLSKAERDKLKLLLARRRRAC